MSAKEIEPQLSEERRRHARRRVLKGALVAFDAHNSVFECQVRDLSDEGAKLTLGSTLGVPDHFDLLIPSQQRIAPARIVWRTEHELGAAITGPWRPHSGGG